MHRVLNISTDYAFCLHSKERVPYHIIIEIAGKNTKEEIRKQEQLLKE